MNITDLTYATSWWFIIFLFGLMAMPICSILFNKFVDLGYGLSKSVGILSVSLIVFVLSMLRILRFTEATILIAMIMFASANLFIYFKYSDNFRKKIRDSLKFILFEEGLFAAGFGFWSYVRAHQPDINGLEKFMDFGFVNTSLRAEYLPPIDMWFSGKPINYYWFGHFATALLTKISSIPSVVTYNLMLATILGLTLISAFSIIASLVKLSNKKTKLRVLFASGFISAILLVFAGNFHTPVYYALEGADEYWYPDATRFIGYNPDVDDKTIHEFPLYSFVVADLHGHLINLPFVLLYIALLANYFVKKDKNPWEVKKLIPLGVVLGAMFMTSTWDFANYSLATLTTFSIYFLARSKLSIKNVVLIGLSGLAVLGISLLVALLFITSFESIAEGVALVHSRSRIWQLAILWGFPAVMTLIYLFVLKYNSTKNKITNTDYFVLALLATSWILIFLPEIIYVKDIYGATHHRANTMFKLTYQAFVMSYLVTGYITARTFMTIKNKYFRVGSLVVFALIFASIMVYPSKAINSYYGDLKTYKGLEGDQWFVRQYPNEYRVYRWMQSYIDGQPIILEAPGDSYTNYNMISAYTGLPTVNGWFVHEWLWRGSSEFPQNRNADIEAIYTSPDTSLAKKLLDKYEVEYVIVGTHEREKYPGLNIDTFEALGDVVHSSGNVYLYKIN